jgi:hypothetical protein
MRNYCKVIETLSFAGAFLAALIDEWAIGAFLLVLSLHAALDGDRVDRK